MEKVLAAKKWDWKTWAVVALGGAAVVAGAAFVMQSKHAAVGRQVHRNVTKFLVDHGSKVNGGIISGGLVSTPMKTNIAVNSVIVSMLNNYNEMLDQNPGAAGSGSPEMHSEEQVTTGKGGVQGRIGQGQGNAPGAALRPISGAPQPVSSASGRAKSPSATVIRNPSEVASDDGGYGSQTGRTGDVKVGEYNAAEFAPQGTKPSGDVDLFAGDGIPSSVSASSGAVNVSSTAGYE